MNDKSSHNHHDGSERERLAPIRGPSSGVYAERNEHEERLLRDFPEYFETWEGVSRMLQARYDWISEEEARDILVESSLAMIRALERADRSIPIASARRYFYSIAENCARKRFGASRSFVSLDALERMPSLVAHQRLRCVEEFADVLDALASLSEVSRDIVICDAAGFTAEETSTWLRICRRPPVNVTPESVRQRLSRARANLNRGVEG